MNQTAALNPQHAVEDHVQCGERLFLTLRDAYVGRGLFMPHWSSPVFSNLNAAEALAFCDAAQVFSMGSPPSPAGEEWKAHLAKYGRHLPGCPTGAPCVCGFDRVEAELRGP